MRAASHLVSDSALRRRTSCQAPKSSTGPAGGAHALFEGVDDGTYRPGQGRGRRGGSAPGSSVRRGVDDDWLEDDVDRYVGLAHVARPTSGRSARPRRSSTPPPPTSSRALGPLPAPRRASPGPRSAPTPPRPRPQGRRPAHATAAARAGRHRRARRSWIALARWSRPWSTPWRRRGDAVEAAEPKVRVTAREARHRGRRAARKTKAEAKRARHGPRSRRAGGRQGSRQGARSCAPEPRPSERRRGSVRGSMPSGHAAAAVGARVGPGCGEVGGGSPWWAAAEVGSGRPRPSRKVRPSGRAGSPVAWRRRRGCCGDIGCRGRRGRRGRSAVGFQCTRWWMCRKPWWSQAAASVAVLDQRRGGRAAGSASSNVVVEHREDEAVEDVGLAHEALARSRARGRSPPARSSRRR